MYTLKDITVIICNWQQTRFTLGAVRNVRKFYPNIKIIVVDDGSKESNDQKFVKAYAHKAYSREERRDNNDMALRKETGELNFTLIYTGVHIGHGSAIDYGVDITETSLILTMDNDIRMLEGGLIEEYLEKLNTNPDSIYAVGTTFTEPSLGARWIDPWFSLYQLAPIKQLHLTFSNFLFSTKEKTFHIGTGAFLHSMMTFNELHRPKIWTAVYYPPPEQIKQLHHLKKFVDDKPGVDRYDMWHKHIDGN